MSQSAEDDRCLLEVTLRSGREIFARELWVTETYSGLLLGGPNDRLNEWLLQNIPSWVRMIFDKPPVLVIPPDYGTDADGDRILPWLRFCALFISFGPIKDPERDASEMVLVWFQNEFHPPISESVRAAIEGVDRDGRARICLCRGSLYRIRPAVTAVSSRPVRENGF